MSTTTMTTTSPADKATEAVDQALTRAQAAAQAKRFGEAAGICNDVLATAPDNAPALALLGMIAAHTNDPERGITMLERAVTLRPGVSSWYANLCALYRIAYRMQDALRVGQEAVRLDPQNADHLVNLSLVFTDVDDRDHAVACLLRALGLRPDHADGHLALGQNLLAMGDFEPGWKEYEWRNLTEAGKSTLPKMTSATWNGMRIPNGRLLMVGDQGYGDTIQFARYIPLIADRCQELILGCSAEMGPLLANIPGVKQYLPSLDGRARPCRALPAVQCSGPCAHHARDDPREGAVPARRCRARGGWRDELDASLPHGVPRIGLAWTGRPTHPNDRRRSIPLARIAPFRRRRPRQLRVAAKADAGSGPGQPSISSGGMTDISARFDRLR